MALTAEQVAQYRRDGYVCPVPVMPSVEAAAIRRQLESVEARQGGKLEPVQRSRAFLLFKWLDDLTSGWTTSSATRACSIPSSS